MSEMEYKTTMLNYINEYYKELCNYENTKEIEDKIKFLQMSFKAEKENNVRK